MTIYFRPDSIEYSYATTSNQLFGKEDDLIYNIMVSLQKREEQKNSILIDYHLDQTDHSFLHKDKFIGISTKGQYQLHIIHKHKNREKQEEQEKLTVVLDFTNEIKVFKGCRNDIFKKQIHLGNYTIECSYGYNKFVQVCGMSKFYQFTIEPSGVVEQRMKKMSKTTFANASKGLLNLGQVQKLQSNQSEDLKPKVRFSESSFKSENKRNQYIQKVNSSQPNNDSLNLGPLNLHSKVQTGKNESKTLVPARQQMKYYRGPCKTSNFFSCLDPNPNIQRQYNFIQQSYE